MLLVTEKHEADILHRAWKHMHRRLSYGPGLVAGRDIACGMRR